MNDSIDKSKALANSTSQWGNAIERGGPVQTIEGAHGYYEINFTTGAFKYYSTLREEYTQAIQVTVVDNDGDELAPFQLYVYLALSTESRIIGGSELELRTDNTDEVLIGSSGIDTFSWSGEKTGVDHVEGFCFDGDGILDISHLLHICDPPSLDDFLDFNSRYTSIINALFSSDYQGGLFVGDNFALLADTSTIEVSDEVTL